MVPAMKVVGLFMIGVGVILAFATAAGYYDWTKGKIKFPDWVMGILGGAAVICLGFGVALIFIEQGSVVMGGAQPTQPIFKTIVDFFLSLFTTTG